MKNKYYNGNRYTGCEDSDSDSDSDSSTEKNLIPSHCPYYIKEQVDCLDKNGHWRSGKIIRVSLSKISIDRHVQYNDPLYRNKYCKQRNN